MSMLLRHYRAPIKLRLNRAALQGLLALNFFAMSAHRNLELPKWAAPNGVSLRSKMGEQIRMSAPHSRCGNGSV
jgi:hypothetical protein